MIEVSGPKSAGKRAASDKAFIEQLKSTLSLVDLVSEHVVLKKAGNQFVGLCPFHSERSPSFTVSEEKKLYHCYGCKKGGDLISFFQEVHGLSFRETLEELSDRAKIALPETGFRSENPELRKKTHLGLKLNRFAAGVFHQNLTSHNARDQSRFKNAKAYLADRGVSEDIIRKFYMGATTEGWSELVDTLAQIKAPVVLAKEIGLIRARANEADQNNLNDANRSQGYFDLFRERILFPIIDARNRVLGFGGRTYNPEAKPKYLNSPDSFLFHKSTVLYGLNQAQKHIRERGFAILVEGYFDTIGLHQAGFEMAVATCGTALSHEHLKILKRLTDKVIVLFDQDEAGKQATRKAMETGLESGLTLMGISWPEEFGSKDIDEVFWDKAKGISNENHVQRFKKELEGALPLVDRWLELVLQANPPHTAEVKSKVLKIILPILSKWTDPLAQSMRLHWLAERLQMSPEILGSIARQSGHVLISQTKEVTNSPVRSGGVVKGIVKKNEKIRSEKVSETEKRVVELLRIYFAYPERYALPIEAFFQKCAELPIGKRLVDLFSSKEIQNWVELIVQSDPLRLSQVLIWGPRMDSAFDQVEWGPELLIWIREVRMQSGPEMDPIWEKERVFLIDSLFQRFWARFSHEIRWSLESAERENDSELQHKLMQDYLDVQRKLRQVKASYDQA